jgi:hypothetical protein
MTKQLIYMLVGAFVSLLNYSVVLASTDNAFLASFVMISSLAFWIGTLTVIIKHES